ncbi:MAG: HVO_0234 family beta-propeller protein [Halobacteriota archaeon]
MSDDDLSIEEKRVYADRTGKVELFVCCGIGLVSVDISGDLVGEFGVERRCVATDAAAGDGRVAVATDEDVLVRRGPDAEFEATNLGPAVAVGVHGGRVLAATPDGRVAATDDDGWTRLGETGGVRAIDGGLVAAADGVYRVTERLQHVGLDDVRDVAGRGIPLAATGEALYALGNGWMDVRDGDFSAVDSDGERAHAVDADGSYAREGDDWQSVDLPTDDSVVGFGYGPDQVLALTESGTLLVDAGEGWRAHALGVPEVVGFAVAQ